MTAEPSALDRRPERSSGREFDVIVVGGGVYGAFTALEAARGGLRTLLLERDDFGGGTSANSLRIAHGGLRYLQTLDLGRFRRSIEERHWLRTHFPDLVEELECLMPLYGRGFRKVPVLRAALAANDLAVGALTGRSRRRGAVADAGDGQADMGAGQPDGWPSSRILGREETEEVFPGVEVNGLRGAAVWYDGFIRHAPRLLMEVLRWSRALGASVLNYVECREIRVRQGAVTGVAAVDRLSGRSLDFRAPFVVNATGASLPRVAAMAGADAPDLFHPTLAFNLLLRCPPPSSHALAIASGRGRGARTWFILPWNGRTLAGTYHGRWTPQREHPSSPAPGEEAIADFLEGLNQALPGLAATGSDIARVYSGILPGGSSEASLPGRRPVVLDHAARGEAAGLVSVAGVKYTTARRVAADILRLIERQGRGRFPRRRPRRPFPFPPCASAPVRSVLLDSAPDLFRRSAAELRAALGEVVRNEAVIHLDDLLLRRTDWGADPEEGREVARFISPHLEEIPEWDRVRRIRNPANRAAHRARGVPSPSTAKEARGPSGDVGPAA